MDYGMNRLIGVIVGVLVQSVIIGAVVIPLIVQESNPGDVEPGEEWSHSLSTNLSDVPDKAVTYTISGGSGQHYCTIEVADNIAVVKGTFPDNGTYSIEITAHTVNPNQYATKTYSVDVQSSSQFSMLLVIPTFLIIGVILYIVNYLGIIDISSVGGYFRRDNGGPVDSINDDWADRSSDDSTL